MKLKLVDKFDIDVKEPSGLCNGFSKNELFTVSDKTGKIYRINKKGKLIETLNYKGKDMEGIAINKKEKMLYCIEEKKKKIVEIDENGETINEFGLPKISKNENSGIEGIAYNEDDNNFYILNEKKPGLLIKWSIDEGIIEKYKIDFADDYSGISYSSESQSLWIVSDESATLTQTNLEGDVIKSYDIPVEKAEGVVVDETDNKVYIISDSDQKLFVFEM